MEKDGISGMMIMQPTIYSERKRPFATSPVAVQPVIVNNQGQLLLLSSPHRNKPNQWQFVSGALDAEETVVEAALREASEEVGDAVRLRPLGVIHAQTFHYDANVRYFIGIYFLMAYEGGEIVPGDDMVDSRYHWWAAEELEQGEAIGELAFHPSTNIPWLFARAVELYHLWKDQDTVKLQPDLSSEQ